MATKSRTITYLRAVWETQEEVSMTLQEIVESCLAGLHAVEDTQIPLRDSLAAIRHRRSMNDRCNIHIAAWTDREAVSTVPHTINEPNCDLSSQAPGKDYDFLDGDGMMLFSKNHCLQVPSGLHPKSMEQYVRNLIGHARESGMKLPEAASGFTLVPIEDSSVVQRIINDGGIKKLDLNVGRYMETVKADADISGPRTIIQKLATGFWETLVSNTSVRLKNRTNSIA